MSDLQFFKVGYIIAPKYGYLMPPGVVPNKVITDIDFTDEAVVQRDVTVVKLL